MEPGSWGLSGGGPLDLLVYEIINSEGAIVWLLSGIFTWSYVLPNFRRIGYWRLKFAIGFGFVCIGECARASWTLAGRLGQSTGWLDTSWMANTPQRFFPLAAMTITAWGAFCAMRTLVPGEAEGGGKYTWVGYTLIVVVFVAAVAAARYHR